MSKSEDNTEKLICLKDSLGEDYEYIVSELTKKVVSSAMQTITPLLEKVEQTLHHINSGTEKEVRNTDDVNPLASLQENALQKLRTMEEKVNQRINMRFK